jgi:hypothetical protein
VHSAIDLAYLAGIVDGEGCVEVRFLSGRTARRTGLDMRIVVGNTDRRLIDWLVETWGGRVHVAARAGVRDMHVWTLMVRSNRELCEALLPHLRLKAEQLALALEAASLSISRGRNPDGTTRTIPPDNLARRAAIVQEVAQLKRGA